MTVYNCLVEYCKKNKKSILPLSERRHLGKKIINAWMEEKIKCTLQYVQSKEPEGIIKVLSYPHFFAKTIFIMIHQYYSQSNKGGVTGSTPRSTGFNPRFIPVTTGINPLRPRFTPILPGSHRLLTGFNPDTTAFNPVERGKPPLTSGFYPVLSGYTPASPGAARGSEPVQRVPNGVLPRHYSDDSRSTPYTIGKYGVERGAYSVDACTKGEVRGSSEKKALPQINSPFPPIETQSIKSSK